MRERARKFPCLVTLYGKHGEERFLVYTPEELQELSLSVVRERMDAGYYPVPLESPLAPPPQPSVPRETARGLPPGAVGDLARKEWAQYDREMRAQEKNSSRGIWPRDLLAGKRADAWEYLCSRSDYEYERVELVEESHLRSWKTVNPAP